MPETLSYDIAVIGGGPAGLAAGLYSARGGAKTIVFEKQMAGGQIVTTNWVENYPAFPQGIAGADLGQRMAEQAQAQGAELALFVNVTAIKHHDSRWLLRTDSGQNFYAHAVIFATGSVPRTLDIPGEKTYTGRGVSWCATCDGAFYRDKTIAVIGGGDAALEEALFLTKFARKIFIVHRREKLRAAQIIVTRAQASEQIELILAHTPTEIIGDGNKVTALRLRGVHDNTERTLDIDGVFEFVGVDPVNGLLADSGLDALTSQGYALVNADGSLNSAVGAEGLFAAGDLTATALKQVVTAAGSGALAGFSALQYLQRSANDAPGPPAV
jgi:thioredoxin reductase (NADPH)